LKLSGNNDVKEKD